jgi:hypothetical protein
MKKLLSLASHTLTALAVLGLASLAVAQSPSTRVTILGASGNAALVNSSGALEVDATVTPSGTQDVQGNVANDAVDSGNPVKNGGKASSSLPAAVTAGDRVDAWYGLAGQQMVGFVSSAATVGADAANQSTITMGTAALVTNTPIGVAGYNFNGTNWDRQRGPAGAVGSSYVENGPYTATRVTADGQIKATAGFVHSVCVTPLTATPTPGLFSLYNSATEAGTVVWSAWIFATASQTCFENLDAVFSTAIYAGYDATLANATATVSFR